MHNDVSNASPLLWLVATVLLALVCGTILLWVVGPHPDPLPPGTDWTMFNVC